MPHPSERRAPRRRGRALPARSLLLLALWTLLAGLLASLLAGCGNGNPYRPTGAAADPAPGPTGPGVSPWRSVAPLSVARWGLAAVSLAGTIYAIGGADSAGQPLDTVSAYDPVSDAWSPRAELPTPRSGLAAVVVGGLIYALGGADAAGTPLDTVEVYDPAGDQWTPGGPSTALHEARADFCGGTPDGQYIPIVGGHSAGGESTTVWVYNTVDPTLAYPTNNALPIAHDFHPACEAVGGDLYALGGRSSPAGGGDTWLDAVSFLDWASATWSARAPLPTAREGLASAQALGRIYAVGGLDGGGQALDTLEAYAPSSDAWSAKTAMPTPRDRAAAVAVGSLIFVLGGRAGNAALNTVEVYDPFKDPN
jgi:Kelch motif